MLFSFDLFCPIKKKKKMFIILQFGGVEIFLLATNLNKQYFLMFASFGHCAVEPSRSNQGFITSAGVAEMTEQSQETYETGKGSIPCCRKVVAHK